MTVWGAIGRQLGHPTGVGGWLTGHVMRAVNARPNALAVAALDLQPTDQVLELGCGPGHAVRLMAAQVPHGTVHAVDQSATMLSQTKRRNRAAVESRRVKLYQSAFEALPVADHSIDKILAVNVAYFWRDREAVLHEIRRVLRPGGLLSVYVTEARTMRRWKFAGSKTHLLFDGPGLSGTLRCGGFREDAIAITGVRLAAGATGLIATARNH